MVKSCEVEFENNPLKICYTGRRIYGKVIIELDKPKVIKGLKLQILGFAHVRFRWDTQTYHDTITYLDSKVDLLKPLGKESEISLKPGEYTFNFETDIPSDSPSSYEGTYGQVRYKTKIVFMRPMLFDQNFCRGFTVINCLNLNTYGPDLSLPVHDEFIKHLCCWPCKSSPLLIDAKLEKSGYVPGESIPVTLSVTNSSKAQVKEISVKLSLFVTYKTRVHVKTKCERITLSECKITLSSNEKSEFKEILKVPPASPTLNQLCEIIDLAYQVYVEGKVTGPHVNPRIYLPVVIGVIPLGIPALGSTNSNNLEDYAIPPPTYQEASYMGTVEVAEEAKEDGDEETFVPMFPICNVRGSCLEINNNCS
ncbi:hypothetical protein ACFFRR_000326 [Megaselia abdita]